MKRSMQWFGVLILTAVVASTGGSFLAQQTKTQPVKDEVALRAAMEKETVQGDLKGAIEQYKKIAQSKDRSVAARAIIRMAECYSKLGDAESQKLYERIVREFADQKEPVALARARLGGATVVAAKGDRAVWTGPGVDLPTGRVSPDGRFITYVNWNDVRLMMHDIAANMDRALTPAPPNYFQAPQQPEWSAVSRDGKQIVYVWVTDKGDELRIAPLQGSGFLQPRTLTTGEFSPFDWSPDGKWIAAVTVNHDRTTAQIGLIAVADGSFRSLKSVDPSVFATLNKPTSIRVSPDGKYVAYDRPAGDASPQRDVFVLAVDGGQEIPAVVHSANDVVMGWSPDGTRLLFSSDRTGSVGLWALPFGEGKAQGPPELLKPDIGPSFSLGVTDSGALYVYKRISSRDIAIAPINLEAGRLLGPPVGFSKGYIEGAAYPNWSPDGKSLAYPVPCNNGCIAIRSVPGGEVRRIASTLTQARAPSWSSDGRSLLAPGKDANGRQGIFQIDVTTGAATAVVLADVSNMAQWAPSGKKVYYRLNNRGVIVERDLVSGAERDVYAGEAGILSPDGQYFSVANTDASAKVSSLLLIPVAGGQPRELLRLTQPEMLGGRRIWTPDSRAVMFDKNTGSRMELWLAPITGGQPRKLDIDPDIWLKGSVPQTGQLGFTLSPDGRNIAVYTGTTVSEVWALENFLPKATAKR